MCIGLAVGIGTYWPSYVSIGILANLLVIGASLLAATTVRTKH